MRKFMLFPFNEDTKILANNASEEYKITVLSSYKEDRKKLEEFQSKTEAVCSTEFDLFLNEVDAVIFAENIMGQKNRGYKDRIELAFEYKKDVFISKSLFRQLEIDKNSYVHFIEDEVKPKKKSGKKLKEISYPIISVMGVGENCGKFQLQTKIHNYIKNKGYAVLTVCSNPLGRFMGMEVLPYFLFSEKLSYIMKVEGFNEWLYQISKKRRIDLILLGYPGGILPFNELETNHYSEIPLLISNAILSDVGILTVYKSFNMKESAFKNFMQLCLYKYNCVVQKFVISENYYKTNFEEQKVRYYRDMSQIFPQEDYKKSGEYSCISIKNTEKINCEIEDILKEMERNFFFI